MRLDKFLTECGIGSRKDVKKIISNKRITVNDKIVISSKENIDEGNDIIKLDNDNLYYKKYRYYMMNKKSGYITAKEDSTHKTVMELLPDWVITKDLTPIGRLDKDTEGILIFTNDGNFNHKALAPKNHIDKTYYVELKNEIDSSAIEKLKNGVDIGNYITKPASVEQIDIDKINLTISEGKFHQVKKMMIAVGNEVVYLKRIKFGKLELKNLEIGEVVEIKKEDIF